MGATSEHLAALALGTERMPANHPGFDLQSSEYGRVQVKSCDGRRGAGMTNLDFDHLLIIEWDWPMGCIQRALIAPLAAVAELARPGPDRRSWRVRTSAVAAHPAAEDITVWLRAALEAAEVMP